MKVLIGYDGSQAGAAALDDVLRAGLPGDTELRIVTSSGLRSQTTRLPDDRPRRPHAVVARDILP